MDFGWAGQLVEEQEEQEELPTASISQFLLDPQSYCDGTLFPITSNFAIAGEVPPLPPITQRSVACLPCEHPVSPRSY